MWLREVLPSVAPGQASKHVVAFWLSHQPHEGSVICVATLSADLLRPANESDNVIAIQLVRCCTTQRYGKLQSINLVRLCSSRTYFPEAVRVQAVVGERV